MRYVCCAVVSARVYPRCHDVHVTMDSVNPLSVRYNKYHLYRGFLPMQACAAGYALTYVTTLKLHLVS
jgi:hypothetical protein